MTVALELAWLFIKNNWQVFALLALLGMVYVKGCSDEKKRFDSFKEQLAATEAKQADWKARRIKTQQEITDASDKQVKADLAGLRTRNADLAKQLQQRASRNIVPLAPNAPANAPEGGEICYDRARLNGGVLEAVDRFLGRSLASVQRGSEKVAFFQACMASWQKQLDAAKLQPQPN